MSKQARRAADILALCAAAALAALLLAPAGLQKPADAPAATRPPAQAQAVQTRAVVPEPATPEQIAALFGWRAPRPVVIAPPPPVPPQAADWLIYLGFVADADGGQRYLYKDKNTGKVVPVAAGESDWRLVEAHEKDLIAQHEGKLYVLKRGK